MGYQFSMEKKTAIVVISGFALVGALLFSAGLLMGVHFGLVSALVSENAQPNQKPAEPAAPTTIAEQTVNRAAIMHESTIDDATNIAPDHALSPRDSQTSVIARDEPRDGVAEPEQEETQIKD